MPKDEVAHYRIRIDGVSHICCREDVSIRDVKYTDDPNDTTCNNCRKTKRFKEALEAKIRQTTGA